MKRKSILILLVIALISAICMGVLVGCKRKTDTTDTNKNKVIITPLADLVDYGALSYLNATQQNYVSRAANLLKLEGKQTEERDKYIAVPGSWDSEEYYDFVLLDNDDIAEGKYETDDDPTTIAKIFCYAEMGDFLDRMASAGVAEPKMQAIVVYICRTDPENRAKGFDYQFAKGTGSALADYDELDELQDIYDNFDDYSTTQNASGEKTVTFTDNTRTVIYTEDEVSDLIQRKKRKILGEVIEIFKNDGAEFARFCVEELSYAVEVVNEIMMPAFNTAKALNYDMKDYMRKEHYDYATLNYFLSFDEVVELNSAYKTTVNSTVGQGLSQMMTLYGYYYQYEKAAYAVFDDSRKVTVNNVQITEYEDYLKLSHKDYFNEQADALRYRNYDHKRYEQAIRYTADFYKLYYKSQLAFQALQEKYDRTIYQGGSGNQYASGIGYADSSNVEYTAEMLAGLNMGVEANLKLSDVNYEYTTDDNNVKSYNTYSKDWNSLNDNQQRNAQNKIKKVRLELAQLKSQNYAMTHPTITEADLTNALKYEIKSYSADYIRNIQLYKKQDVTYNNNITRMLKAWGYGEELELEVLSDATAGSENYNKYQTYVDEKEDIGINLALYEHLTYDYANAGIEGQITTAQSANWPGVKGNIATTLAVNFEKYQTDYLNNPSAFSNTMVDQYFEETLIKRTYTCGGTATECLYDNNHINCDKEYDTSWALSLLINNHEAVMRYMYGQIEVNFQQFKAAGEFQNYTLTGTEGYTTAGMCEVPQNFSRNNSYKDSGTLEKIMTNDEISTIIGTDGKKIKPVPFVNGQSYDYTWKTTNDVNTYYYTFDCWCIDKDGKYPVDPTNDYGFDIRLYPRYRIEKA